jgi:hypothetical protein
MTKFIFLNVIDGARKNISQSVAVPSGAFTNALLIACPNNSPK